MIWLKLVLDGAFLGGLVSGVVMFRSERSRRVWFCRFVTHLMRPDRSRCPTGTAARLALLDANRLPTKCAVCGALAWTSKENGDWKWHLVEDEQ